MSHHHEHEHEHHHNHGSKLSFEDQLKTLFTHWVDHNNSHMDNYTSWAGKAEKENFKETAALLRQAAEESQTITQTLEKALQSLKS